MGMPFQAVKGDPCGRGSDTSGGGLNSALGVSVGALGSIFLMTNDPVFAGVGVLVGLRVGVAVLVGDGTSVGVSVLVDVAVGVGGIGVGVGAAWQPTIRTSAMTSRADFGMLTPKERLSRKMRCWTKLARWPCAMD
jgi:hypothetical protein